MALSVSAHRHGNDAVLLRLAEARGVDYVEVDVHRYRSRLEARHEKTVGPIPILWDRRKWPRWNPTRPHFAEIVEAADADTVFHIDLKGFTSGVARHTAAALSARDRYVVSTRSWWLLRHFDDLDHVITLRSVGARWQRRMLRRHLSRARSGDGVSIASGLLNRELAEAVKMRGLLLFVWGVHTLDDARRVASWNADVVIVDSLDLADEIRSFGRRGEHEREAAAP